MYTETRYGLFHEAVERSAFGGSWGKGSEDPKMQPMRSTARPIQAVESAPGI